MATICWTVLHPGGASASHGAHHLGHAVGHVIRPIVHQSARLPRYAASAARRSHPWAQIVCKMIPGIVGGVGLLAPQPVNPLPPDRPAFFAPAPALIAAGPAFLVPSRAAIAEGPASGASGVATRIPGDWIDRRDIPGGSRAGAGPAPQAVPEPSTAGLMLSGIAGLLVLRIAMRGLS